MPPRLNLAPACRSLAIRAKPVNQLPQINIAARAQARCFSDRNNNTIPRQQAGRVDPLTLPAFGETRPQPVTDSAAVEDAVPETSDNENALNYLQLVAYGVSPVNAEKEGHKFGLPELPLPSEKHIKHRYDPIVDQMTRLLMKDGKLGKAQRVGVLTANVK